MRREVSWRKKRRVPLEEQFAVGKAKLRESEEAKKRVRSNLTLIPKTKQVHIPAPQNGKWQHKWANVQSTTQVEEFSVLFNEQNRTSNGSEPHGRVNRRNGVKFGKIQILLICRTWRCVFRKTICTGHVLWSYQNPPQVFSVKSTSSSGRKFVREVGKLDEYVCKNCWLER